MNSIAIYTVKVRKTGEMLVRGTAEECSREIGITYSTFLTLCNRSKNGKNTKLSVEKVGTIRLENAVAKKWDAAFGWLRVKKTATEYPCNGCMRRASCEFTDTYCPRWAEWYRAAHEAAAATLKARGGAE